MLYGLFLALALSAGAGSETSSPPLVRRVEVDGNRRFPTPGILRIISSAPGKPYDDAAAGADLRKLHATGFFQDVSVTSQPSEDGGVDVFVHLVEYPYISEFVITGIGPGLEQRVRDVLRKEKLALRPASPYSPARSSKAAALVRNLLRAQRYPLAEVTVEPEPAGHLVRANMRVRTGPHLKVGRVEFGGNSNVKAGELLAQMKHTRSGSIWAFGSDAGRYLPEELAADLESIRRLYQSRGFATAHVGPPEIVAQNTGSHMPLLGRMPELRIRIPVVEGPQFTLAAVSVASDGKPASERARRPCAPDSRAVPLRPVCARIGQDGNQPGTRTRGLRHGGRPARAVF